MDFRSALIDLVNPAIEDSNKGRAVVPMNDQLKARLLRAKEASLGPHVVDYGGKPIKCVTKGFKAAMLATGFPEASPNTIQHAAA